jgi:hypothetical protein
VRRVSPLLLSSLTTLSVRSVATVTIKAQAKGKIH